MNTENGQMVRGLGDKMAKLAEQDLDAMLPSERRATRGLAGIYALRMMGLFMILPVFALYAETLADVTPFLIGLAIGIYGLTQALLQIPFGFLSDKIGRKPVIVGGLIIFALGSVIAALADSIYGVIFGRAVQGAGAIAAAIMALTADLTREEQRVKAMATIGISIGLAFAFSLIVGPILNNWIGVDGIFWLTAVLALGGIYVLLRVVPTPLHSRFHRDAQPVPQQFKTVLRDAELLRLDIGIFVLHMVLTASFVVLPIALVDEVKLASVDHWWIYLPVMILAMGLMVPFIIIAEKRRKMKQIMTGAVFVLMFAEFLLFSGYHSFIVVFIAILLFFIAFNVLEASLPSMIAKTAPPDIKGTAMGVYSSCQFLGAFIGGVTGGLLYGWFGVGSVFLFCGVMLLVWFVLVSTMRNPRYLGSFMINVGPIDKERASHLVAELTRVTGVAEAVVIPEDGIAYLKVDNHAVDKKALLRFRHQQSDDGLTE